MVCSGGPELVDDADGLFELPPQAERSKTAGARIQTRRIVTSYGKLLRPVSRDTRILEHGSPERHMRRWAKLQPAGPVAQLVRAADS
jgi:hypothetical protein